MNLRITRQSESCLTTLTTIGIPFSLFHGLSSERNMGWGWAWHAGGTDWICDRGSNGKLKMLLKRNSRPHNLLSSWRGDFVKVSFLYYHKSKLQTVNSVTTDFIQPVDLSNSISHNIFPFPGHAMTLLRPRILYAITQSTTLWSSYMQCHLFPSIHNTL
jgi:hypothetical protein